MIETVLIIDDNRQISSFLAGNVLPSLGYDVLVAYTGKQGLDLVRQHHRFINLILLDLQIPDMSGLDLLRQMDAERISIPTILMTAHGSEQVAVDAFRLGVQDYLNKPVDVDILSRTIERALTISRLRREREQLHTQMQDQVEWLTALSQVSKSLTSSLDTDVVLKRIVEAGVSLTKAQEGFLALVDQPGGQLYLRAVKNIEEKIVKTLRLPITDSLAGIVLTTRRPLRKMIDDPDQPVKVSTGFLVHSLLHVPILSKDVPLGLLSVDNRTLQQSFTEKDEAVLLSLADYAAVALENANLYDQAQRELGERRRIESALRESEERYALAVRGANDGLWDWDMRHNRVYYSPRWKHMLGFADAEISSSPNEWLERIHKEDSARVQADLKEHLDGLSAHFESEHRLALKDGSYLWVLSRGLAVRDSSRQVTRIAGSLTDISERKKSEERLLFDALHDSLTGLRNRTALVEQLRLAIERTRRYPEHQFALLYLDLDRFKDVNDSQGHIAGDQLLRVIAQKLSAAVRPSDTVARLGGDEFVVLLDEIRDIRDATVVAERIQAELDEITRKSPYRLTITASIGIVLSITGYRLPDEILRDADIAMYRAKAAGKARYEVFDPAMRERLIARLRLETELRQALVKNQLSIHYQPVLSLADQKVLGCEALLRWQHPQLGMFTPIDFISVAEDSGLIIPIDLWVLRSACKQMRQWQQTIPGAEHLKISVNLSVRHFSQTTLVEEIQKTLADTGLDPDDLLVEITENIVMEHSDLPSAVISELKGLGVQIYIDDFGVGSSNLNYLSHFPMNALKIDKSFIASMQHDPNSMKIIQAIVNMSHLLEMKVIAEGVETSAQMEDLKAFGCDFAQGFLVGKPLSSHEMQEALQRAFQ